MSPTLRWLKNLIWTPPKNPLPPFNFKRLRFPSKTRWPPQLHELTDHQQFRFERKFKRRLRMKAVDENWNNNVKVATWGIISSVVIYTVFIHDFVKDPNNPKPDELVFEGVRGWVGGLWGGLWTANPLDTLERDRRKAIEDDGVERDLLGVPIEGRSVDQELMELERRQAERARRR